MAWVVLIEQIEGSGDRLRWALAEGPWSDPPEVHAGPFEEFSEATEAALGLAGRHEPSHPWSERARRAYRVSPSEYIVNVVGATRRFHFRIVVAEEVDLPTVDPLEETEEGRPLPMPSSWF
ncbi:hypothetical protein ACFW3Z_17000 [Nocardiopsis alba]|jgi:hypothetical protein|uniref:hypothetical protein n=1 Tax=Nocardiopsis alba TaxID=53437 RepID=UPI0033A4C40F